MVPASPLSRSATPGTFTNPAFTSHDIFAPSHLPVAAVLARSASAIASTLVSSHLPTTASGTEPASTSSSAPAPPRTTSWYSAPNTRGTWNLLITCLITVNLCVWTAVHLNIQPKIDQSQPFRKRLWNNYYCRRVRWVMLGLLAPELVVYTAWMQWESARKFAEKTGMTLTHGFYAGMGAYCIEPEADTASCDQDHGPTELYNSTYADCEDRERGLKRMVPGARHAQKFQEGPSLLYTSMLLDSNTNVKSQPAGIQATDWSLDSTPYSLPRLYLTARGVHELVDVQKISLPTKENITERSKSDLLAKTLVCLQAGYIIVQCVSRLASGLPLTFLEINTLGHVLCALVMYSFWLHKPQDLSLSITLDHDLAKLLRTWHHCCRHVSSIRWFCDLYKVVWERAKSSEHFGMFEAQSPPSTSLQATQFLARKPSIIEGYPTELAVASLTDEDYLLVVQFYPSNADKDDSEMMFREDKVKVWSLFTGIYLAHSREFPPRYIESNSRVHLGFQSMYRTSESAMRQLLDAQTEPFNYSRDQLQEEIHNWPSKGLLSSHTYLPTVAIAISTALYGGLHAAAWYSFFPSLVEKRLWRVSSIIIAGSGMSFALSVAANHLFWQYYTLDYISRSQRLKIRSLLLRVLNTIRISIRFLTDHTKIKLGILCCLGVVCVISRIYLVAEAFISLRKIPIEVYQTPDWTQWIPHL